MAKPHLKLVPPRIVNGTVPPRRRKNAELRTREYLTGAEVERLMKAARANRHGLRDAAMILMAFRHGLRAAELVDLRWDQVELGRNAVLHVRRVKQGVPSVHPLQGDEVAVCVHIRACCAVHDSRVRQNDRAGRGSGQAQERSTAHASPRLRLCPREQGPRYARIASVPWSQKYSAHGAVHGIESDTF